MLPFKIELQSRTDQFTFLTRRRQQAQNGGGLPSTPQPLTRSMRYHSKLAATANNDLVLIDQLCGDTIFICTQVFCTLNVISAMSNRVSDLILHGLLSLVFDASVTRLLEFWLHFFMPHKPLNCIL